MEESNKSLKEIFSDYLDWLELEKGLSTKSQENYSRFLNKFFDFLNFSKIEEIKPHEITNDHIWKYRLFLSRQSKTPLKRSTQNYYLIALRSFLTYFAEKDILSLPPEKVKLPKDKAEKTVNFLNLDQVKNLFDSPNIDSIQGIRDRTILESLFSTGLRVAELVSLDKEQIKIKEGQKELEIGIIGKGSHPRTVYFSERAVKWLKTYTDTRKDDEKALFINYRGKKPGERLSVRSVERMVKKYVIQSGLPITTSCHTLRHSFATDLLIKGVDIRVVQEFLGHKNIATTQVYTHVTRPHLKEIHEKYHNIE